MAASLVNKAQAEDDKVSGAPGRVERSTSRHSDDTAAPAGGFERILLKKSALQSAAAQTAIDCFRARSAGGEQLLETRFSWWNRPATRDVVAHDALSRDVGRGCGWHSPDDLELSRGNLPLFRRHHRH